MSSEDGFNEFPEELKKMISSFIGRLEAAEEIKQHQAAEMVANQEALVAAQRDHTAVLDKQADAIGRLADAAARLAAAFEQGSGGVEGFGAVFRIARAMEYRNEYRV